MARYKRTHLPCAARRGLAQKYSCEPGKTVSVECHWCDEVGTVKWPLLKSGKPSGWPIFSLTVDHLLPLFRGGTHAVSNLVFACRWCNSSRSSKTVEEFDHYIDTRLSA